MRHQLQHPLSGTPTKSPSSQAVTCSQKEKIAIDPSYFRESNGVHDGRSGRCAPGPGALLTAGPASETSRWWRYRRVILSHRRVQFERRWIFSLVRVVCACGRQPGYHAALVGHAGRQAVAGHGQPAEQPAIIGARRQRQQGTPVHEADQH